MMTKWPQFETKVRRAGSKLLPRLDEFRDAILVTGCQRSGTTMLAKIIAESEGVRSFKLGASDACLDAGLILSGNAPFDADGSRVCFQTTHVDERYQEYFEYSGDYRMVWCLRNPLSVVYSLVYNWSRWGLDTTFMRCGVERLESRPWAMSLLGARAVDKLTKACMIYNAKVSQIWPLSESLRCKGFVVVEYDELVTRKNEILPRVYQFLDLEYREQYADKILSSSLSKSDKLSASEISTIERLCGPVYQQAKDEFWEGPAGDWRR